jgi:hypothetical protein
MPPPTTIEDFELRLIRAYLEAAERGESDALRRITLKLEICKKFRETCRRNAQLSHGEVPR